MAIIMQYVYISVDTFYIFIFIITCTYIFFQFRRQKKLRGNMALTKKKNQDQFNLTLPILVIAIFILFNVCPNFLGIFMRTSSGDQFSMESEIPRVMYTLGWISDPLIYFCTHRTRPRPNIYKENTRKWKLELHRVNPLFHNVLKWSDTLWKSWSICCKIFKVCLTISLVKG